MSNTPDDEPLDPKMPLQLVLTVGQINQILYALGKLPLNEVINTFNALQSQGNMAAAAVKAAAGQLKPNGSGEDPPPPPAKPPETLN